MSSNQINLMLDLIQLGKAISYYSGYYKAPDADTGRLEDFCIEGTKIDDDEFLKTYFPKSKINNEPPRNNVGNTSQTASFSSFSVSIKNYISIIVKVKVPEKWADDIAKHLKVYTFENSNEESKNSDPISIITDPAIINAYNAEIKQPMIKGTEIKDGVCYVSVEIKLSLMDFGKQFYMELVNDTDKVESWYVYGLYNYCQAKLEDKDAKLSQLVKRIYHIGDLATYWNTGDDYTLWSKPNQEVA